MELSAFFPIWNQLTQKQQLTLSEAAMYHLAKKGEILHNGDADCIGFLAVCCGQLRAYISSDEGREITLYRLFERDICLLSASCMMQNIQFGIVIEAEKDTSLYIIPAKIYHQVMTESAALANYTNQIMASRFTDVMWLMEQIMWKSQDKRLAAFLIEESSLEDSPTLFMTHEKIANHIGTAREVITRLLRYFQTENMVSLSRGTIELTDIKRLKELAEM